MEKLALLVAVGTLACQSAEAPHGPQPAAPGAAPAGSKGLAQAPEPVETGAETVWDYLREKYDGDRDGTVSRTEYGRDDASFARLDADHDGTLADADFAQVSEMEVEMASIRARIFVTQVFQSDEDPSTLTVVELEETVAMLDANFDGVLDAQEVSGAVAGLETLDNPIVRMLLKDAEAFAAMVSEVDEDGDGRLGRTELLDYFVAGDENGDLVWESMIPGGRSGPEAAEATAAARPPITSGIPEGEPAPDFTLTSPDGDRTVTLSSFRGSKPVALIFGSYT